jgi:hypothetical protein
MHQVLSAANADATAWAMSFFFDSQIVHIDFVTNFEFGVTHRAAVVLSHVTSLVRRKRHVVRFEFFSWVHLILHESAWSGHELKSF